MSHLASRPDDPAALDLPTDALGELLFEDADLRQAGDLVADAV
jgi:hypothetical protein